MKRMGLFSLWYCYAEFIGMCRFFRLFKPAGFIPHKHFAVFNNAPMSSQVTPALHPDASSVPAIIEPGVKTLGRVTAFRGVNPKSNGYFYRALDWDFWFNYWVVNHKPEAFN
jgi:hypothetical protein